MIIRDLYLKKKIKNHENPSTLQKEKKPSTTTTNSYYSNTFHTFVGRNRFVLLRVAVPILNYVTYFWNFSI